MPDSLSTPVVVATGPGVITDSDFRQAVAMLFGLPEPADALPPMSAEQAAAYNAATAGPGGRRCRCRLVPVVHA